MVKEMYCKRPFQVLEPGQRFRFELDGPVYYYTGNGHCNFVPTAVADTKVMDTNIEVWVCESTQDNP